MSRLSWMDIGTHFFETGISKGVLYVGTDPGVAWTGLTSVVEKSSGGDPDPYYIDGVKYLNIPADEEFLATITAFTYPDEFAPCIGNVSPHAGLVVTAQYRQPFGFSYRTVVGNDVLADNFGYKIHLVYNASAAPSDRAYKTLGSDANPLEFSWDISTKPPKLIGYKNTAHFELDSRHSSPQALAVVEDILYGTEVTAPRLPELAELITIFEDNATFSVIDHGDGSFTVSGPDAMVHMLDANSYELVSDSAIVLDVNSYELSSL